jgi:hypothetical protein
MLKASRPRPTCPPPARATTPARTTPAANPASPADTPGLLIAVPVTAAGVSDSAAGQPLPTHLAATHPTITKIWADSAYHTKVIESSATRGIDVEVVRRDPTSRASPSCPAAGSPSALWAG